MICYKCHQQFEGEGWSFDSNNGFAHSPSCPVKKIETFEDSVAFARELMLEGGKAAAKQLGIAPPTLREEKTLTGIRLVVVWPDGEETNECVIQRTDDQTQAEN